MFCWCYQSSHLFILLIHWMFVCEAAASSQRRGASVFERINCDKNTPKKNKPNKKPPNEQTPKNQRDKPTDVLSWSKNTSQTYKFQKRASIFLWCFTHTSVAELLCDSFIGFLSLPLLIFLKLTFTVGDGLIGLFVSPFFFLVEEETEVSRKHYLCWWVCHSVYLFLESMLSFSKVFMTYHTTILSY